MTYILAAPHGRNYKEKLLVTEEGMSRTACDGRTVAARWLALIIIAQKSKEGGKERERVGREAEGRMGWNLLAVSCAALAEGEAMDVRLRIEEKKNRKPSKTR
jgi:hypothetical protein